MKQEKIKIFSAFSERFSEMLDYLNINENEFGKILGYGRSQTIYDIRNGRNKPSFEFFYRFLNSEFAEKVDIVWLISGMGVIDKKEIPKVKITDANEFLTLRFEEVVRLNERKDTKIKELENKISILEREKNKDSEVLSAAEPEAKLKQE